MTRGLLLALLLLSVRFAVMPLFDLVDSTETRYALIGRDMARSGDYITPHIWTSGKLIPYWGKPPLQFWMIAGSMNLLGETGLAARLPSCIVAALLLLLFHMVIRKLLSQEIADGASCILATSPLYFVGAGAVLTDVTLTFSVCCASLCLWAATESRSTDVARYWNFGLFASLAVGMLTKGPIALVIFAIPVALWTISKRDMQLFRRRHWTAGLALFAVITVPWYWLCEIRNPGFLRYFLLNENFLRYFRKQYGDLYGSGHQFPYGTAFAFLAFGCLPWLLWLLFLLLRTRNWRLLDYRRHAPVVQFFCLGVIGYTLFLSAARQLLSTYLIPVLPWMAVWLAVTLKDFGINRKQILRAAIVISVLYAIGFTVAAPFINRRSSSRHILELAREHVQTSEAKDSVYFVRHSPFSAYFYGGDILHAHEMEQADDSFRNAKEVNRNAIFIISHRNLKRINAANLAGLKLLNRYGAYGVYDWVDVTESSKDE